MVDGIGSANRPVVQSFDGGKRIELAVSGTLTRKGVEALLEQARSTPAYNSAKQKYEFRMTQRGDQSVLQLKRRGSWESFKGTLSAMFSFSTSRQAQSDRRTTERQAAADQLYQLLEKDHVSNARQKQEASRWHQEAATRSGAQKIARAVDAGLQAPDESAGSGVRRGEGRYVPPTFEYLAGGGSYIETQENRQSFEHIGQEELNRNTEKVASGQVGDQIKSRGGSLAVGSIREEQVDYLVDQQDPYAQMDNEQRLSERQEGFLRFRQSFGLDE